MFPMLLLFGKQFEFFTSGRKRLVTFHRFPTKVGWPITFINGKRRANCVACTFSTDWTQDDISIVSTVDVIEEVLPEAVFTHGVIARRSKPKLSVVHTAAQSTMFFTLILPVLQTHIHNPLDNVTRQGTGKCVKETL
jgi:hypothetical protein